MSKFWRAVENFYGSDAVPVTWRGAMGSDYEPGNIAFLRATEKQSTAYPCPHECGCWHDVVEHDEGDIVGVCCCDPEESNCDTLTLTAEDLPLFELNTAKLGREVARAFGCEAKKTDLGLPGTWQIAAFSGAAVPVVLTFQDNAEDFRNTVTHLICKLGERFVLLAPTSRYVDGISLGLLAGAKAGFFDLESNLILLSSGVLQARKSGGELFSALLPEKAEALEQGEAAKVVAILAKLRSERIERKAPLFEVFNLLVMDGCTQEMAAMKCGCTASTMSVRVKEMEGKFGMSVETLRKFATAVNESAVVVKGERWRKRSDGAAPDAYEMNEDENSDDDN